MKLSPQIVVLIVAASAGLWVPAVSAQTVSSTDLINSARFYDGTKVIYEGEAIGEMMVRGDYAWVNASDGMNAIGIWVPADRARTVILNHGGYGTTGDLIRFEGVFHRSCTEHGGDLDIHALEVVRLEAGASLDHPLDSGKVRVAGLCAAILLVPLLFLWIVSRKPAA